jgi:hypothetical protein
MSIKKFESVFQVISQASLDGLFSAFMALLGGNWLFSSKATAQAYLSSFLKVICSEYFKMIPSSFRKVVALP